MDFREYSNVVEPFLEEERAHPHRIAIIFGNREISYGELNAQINRFAHVLQNDLGVRAGDRVAYLLPNCPELIELYYALQKIGAVAVPLNFKLIAREVAYLVDASGSRVLVFAKSFTDKVLAAIPDMDSNVRLASIGGPVEGALNLVQACAEADTSEPELFRDPSSLTRIQYTGGSTGLPKGAARTHHADLVELASVTDSCSLSGPEENVVLIQSPLEHHGGHSWFTSALATGAKLIICEAFDAEKILSDIDRHKVTHMLLLPPTTYQRLLRCPTIDQFDLSSVRIVQSAAGATTRAMIKAVYDKFPHAVLNYGWGQSESGTGTSLRITRDMLVDDAPQLASVGKPMPFAQMRIVDENDCDVPVGEIGEMLVLSEAVMEGYYGQPELTKKMFTPDGWLRTGDMMRQDEQGNFYICSRKKDVVKSGGENVFISEVEAVLREDPDIDDCMVFGTSDPVMGEAVAAVVQPRPGSALTVAHVQAHCKRKLASFKKPRYVVFMDDMGRDDAGKIRKDSIVEYFEAHKEQAAPRFHDKVCDDPEIYLIQVPFSGGMPIGYTNVYYIKMPARSLLIDAGTSHEASYEVLQLALDDLHVDMNNTDIFLTHFHIDHMGLAAAVAHEETRVFLGAEDEEIFRVRGSAYYRGTLKKRLDKEGFTNDDLEFLDDTDTTLIPRASWPMPNKFVNLADGDEITYGSYCFKVIATPGHTPGHRCLYMPDQHIMFYGDHVLMNSSPNIAPFSGVEDSLFDYMDSLCRIEGYPVEMAFMGHGAVDGRANAKKMPDRLNWLIAHHVKRLRDILQVLSEHPGMSGIEIAKSIHWSIPYERWEDIPIIQRWIISGETVAHLDHLKRENYVRVEEREGINRYFISVENLSHMR